MSDRHEAAISQRKPNMNKMYESGDIDELGLEERIEEAMSNSTR